MPARRHISEELVQEWSEAYLIDHASLSEIARIYGASRALVRSRLEEFHPGMTDDLAHPGGSDRPREETYGHGTAIHPEGNGHGEALGGLGP